MSRRSLVLAAFSLATLSLAACTDTTAPTSSTANTLQPTQVHRDMCTGGYLDSTGRKC